MYQTLLSKEEESLAQSLTRYMYVHIQSLLYVMCNINIVPYLKNCCAILKVSEALHYVLIEDLNRLLPVGGEPSD